MSSLCTVASVHFVMQGVPRHETLLSLWQVLPRRGIDRRRRRPTSSSGDFDCGVRAQKSFHRPSPATGDYVVITVCQLHPSSHHYG